MSVLQFINQSGICYYISTDGGNNDQCEVSSFSIIPISGHFTKVSFDFGESANYDSGTIRGHLFDDGKFLGTAHYVDYPNYTREEKWSGIYTIQNNKIHIKGRIFIDNDHSLDFRIEIDKLKSKKIIDTGNHKFEFSKSHYNKLIKLSSTLKDKSNTTSYYSQALSLKLKPLTTNDLYTAMCVAYSWMPTMLDIYSSETNSLKNYLSVVQRLGKVKVLKDIIKNEAKIKEDLVQLFKLINNSIVGTSKMLHLFYPKQFPIIDSKVLIGWNNFFKMEIKDNPDLKLQEHFAGKPEGQVDLYIKYWKLILEWSESLKGSTIREIEEAFYWIGKATDK